MTRRSARAERWGPTLLIAATLAVYFFVTRPAAAPPGWGTDFDSAMREAGASGKNVVVAFHSEGCPPCAAMERTVLRSDVVRTALDKFIPVRVDVTHPSESAARYLVEGTPTYLVLSPNWRLLGRAVGYQSEEAMLRLLQTAGAAPQPITSPSESAP